MRTHGSGTRRSAVRASEHGVQEDVHAGDGVVEFGVFGFVVGHAVAAGGEDRGGGGDAGEVVGVVAGLAEDVAVGDIQLPGGFADEADAGGVEALAAELPFAGDAALAVCAGGG